jgi:malonate transporter
MQAILAVTVPFFALVACGYLAAQRRVLPESAIPGLNVFVLYFALPCMLFRFGMTTPVRELLDPGLIAVYVVSALTIVGFTISLTRSRETDLKDASFGALVAAFPNSGFMGVPLLVALVGPAGAGPAILTMLVDMMLTSSLCIALAQAHEASGQGARAAGWKALRGALSNPLPWSIAAGMLLSALGWRTSGPVDVFLRMLADAASPVALFTIGAVLWRAGRHAHTRPAPRHYVPVALIKLLLHPLLVFSLLLGARALGLGLTAFQIMAMTLVAALPSASNVSLLAERYGADNGRVAYIILLSTALSFVTFTLLAWAFGVQPGSG